MSLINLLKKRNNIKLFTTPSHSQSFFIFPKFRQFYKYDISETEAYNPQEALDLAEKKAAKIYKTKSTHFLINGSTSGIIAAILSCVNAGEKVLIWDNAHPCHINAVKLAGAIPVFYSVPKDNKWGIFSETPTKVIEDKFKKEKIAAVIITSPTYEGVVSDIKSLKEICKKYGAYLIVDEAHGALYPFCDKLPESAIYQGADFVIQSLHKTAGGLNPTALLHCNLESRHCETKETAELCEASDPVGAAKRVETENIGFKKECPPKQSHCNIDIKSTLGLISTTSPSYPLLASIEKNINYLNSKKGRAKILELINTIEDMKKNLTNCEFYNGDPTKIVIKNDKMNGYDISEFLFENKIEDEKTNEVSTMLLCGVGTDLKKITRLEKVLKKF